MSELEFTDQTDLAKVLVRAVPDGSVATELGVPYGHAVREATDALVAGTAPGAWLMLSPAGTAGSVRQRLEHIDGGGFVTVVDVTHAHSAVRLTGSAAANVLATVCAIDLSDEVTPDGTAVRTLLAGIPVTTIRDDTDGERSYLVLCDRSYGRYLIDALTDAGQGFATAHSMDGVAWPGSY